MSNLEQLVKANRRDIDFLLSKVRKLENDTANIDWEYLEGLLHEVEEAFPYRQLWYLGVKLKQLKYLDLNVLRKFVTAIDGLQISKEKLEQFFNVMMLNVVLQNALSAMEKEILEINNKYIFSTYQAGVFYQALDGARSLIDLQSKQFSIVLQILSFSIGETRVNDEYSYEMTDKNLIITGPNVDYQVPVSTFNIIDGTGVAMYETPFLDNYYVCELKKSDVIVYTMLATYDIENDEYSLKQKVSTTIPVQVFMQLIRFPPQMTNVKCTPLLQRKIDVTDDALRQDVLSVVISTLRTEYLKSLQSSLRTQDTGSIGAIFANAFQTGQLVKTAAITVNVKHAQPAAVEGIKSDITVGNITDIKSIVTDADMHFSCELTGTDSSGITASAILVRIGTQAHRRERVGNAVFISTMPSTKVNCTFTPTAYALNGLPIQNNDSTTEISINVDETLSDGTTRRRPLILQLRYQVTLGDNTEVVGKLFKTVDGYTYEYNCKPWLASRIVNNLTRNELVDLDALGVMSTDATAYRGQDYQAQLGIVATSTELQYRLLYISDGVLGSSSALNVSLQLNLDGKNIPITSELGFNSLLLYQGKVSAGYQSDWVTIDGDYDEAVYGITVEATTKPHRVVLDANGGSSVTEKLSITVLSDVLEEEVIVPFGTIVDGGTIAANQTVIDKTGGLVYLTATVQLSGNFLKITSDIDSFAGTYQLGKEYHFGFSFRFTDNEGRGVYAVSDDGGMRGKFVHTTANNRLDLVAKSNYFGKGTKVQVDPGVDGIGELDENGECKFHLPYNNWAIGTVLGTSDVELKLVADTVLIGTNTAFSMRGISLMADDQVLSSYIYLKSYQKTNVEDISVTEGSNVNVEFGFTPHTKSYVSARTGSLQARYSIDYYHNSVNWRSVDAGWIRGAWPGNTDRENCFPYTIADLSYKTFAMVAKNQFVEKVTMKSQNGQVRSFTGQQDSSVGGLEGYGDTLGASYPLITPATFVTNDGTTTYYSVFSKSLSEPDTIVGQNIKIRIDPSVKTPRRVHTMGISNILLTDTIELVAPDGISTLGNVMDILAQGDSILDLLWSNMLELDTRVRDLEQWRIYVDKCLDSMLNQPSKSIWGVLAGGLQNFGTWIASANPLLGGFLVILGESVKAAESFKSGDYAAGMQHVGAALIEAFIFGKTLRQKFKSQCDTSQIREAVNSDVLSTNADDFKKTASSTVETHKGPLGDDNYMSKNKKTVVKLQGVTTTESHVDVETSISFDKQQHDTLTPAFKLWFNKRYAQDGARPTYSDEKVVFRGRGNNGSPYQVVWDEISWQRYNLAHNDYTAFSLKETCILQDYLTSYNQQASWFGPVDHDVGDAIYATPAARSQEIVSDDIEDITVPIYGSNMFVAYSMGDQSALEAINCIYSGL